MQISIYIILCEDTSLPILAFLNRGRAEDVLKATSEKAAIHQVFLWLNSAEIDVLAKKCEDAHADFAGMYPLIQK